MKERNLTEGEEEKKDMPQIEIGFYQYIVWKIL